MCRPCEIAWLTTEKLRHRNSGHRVRQSLFSRETEPGQKDQRTRHPRNLRRVSSIAHESQNLASTLPTPLNSSFNPHKFPFNPHFTKLRSVEQNATDQFQVESRKWVCPESRKWLCPEGVPAVSRSWRWMLRRRSALRLLDFFPRGNAAASQLLAVLDARISGAEKGAVRFCLRALRWWCSV